MKAMWFLVAVVSSLACTAALALANPALMKKHEGYPNADRTGIKVNPNRQ